MSDALFQLAFIGSGGPEILVVMLVLLLLFGSKDAPRIFRKLNEIINQIRNTADGFKREVMYGDLMADKPAPDLDVVDDAAYENLDDHEEEFVGREPDPVILSDEDGDPGEDDDAEKA